MQMKEVLKKEYNKMNRLFEKVAPEVCGILFVYCIAQDIKHNGDVFYLGKCYGKCLLFTLLIYFFLYWIVFCVTIIVKKIFKLLEGLRK